MKTLLIAATHAELGSTIAHFSLDPQLPFQTHEKFDLLITGVGMTATAFALGRFVSAEHSLLLNLGIAGAFNDAIPLGSLVRVDRDKFSELGAEDEGTFLSLEQLGFGAAEFSTHNRRSYPMADQLPAAAGITVNTVHGCAQSITQVLAREQRAEQLVESMEGAAVFYAAQQLQIDCLQVRAISNKVERRNRETWQIGAAVRALNEWAIAFLSNS
ncbi:futalosine hydrolase [Pedobacter sp. SYP-B3415]|uniref:futalosine hydrolase n=1 Tax=Pedobacter sp. SYP-B3415 TaxID=2496641 RepID=UPI00101BE272|nr:futalosine hydrolase [Pedobacter sp. SYP-B3415]